MCIIYKDKFLNNFSRTRFSNEISSSLKEYLDLDKVAIPPIANK